MANVVRRGVATICTARSLEEIPSPNGALPILGHYLQIRRRPGNLSSLYEKYFKELGPIFKVKIPGGKNIVCFADPDGMESVYRNEGANPIRTYTAPANFQWFYNKEKRPVPFVFQTGKKWKELRTMHSKQSAPNNVYKHIPGFISATNRLIRNISKYATTEDGYIEDINPLIMSWSLEASIYFTMGADLDLIESASTEETQSFQKGISTLISTIDDFAMALPIFKLFPTKITRDLKKATDDLYSVGEKYINKHLQETNTGHSLIEQWLQDDKLSKKDMIMSAIFLFGTGVDTILSNSIFMLYELSKHPEIQDKVYHEVVSVLGEKGEVDSITLQKMPYLGQVIKETQRYIVIYLKCPDTEKTANSAST
jgi:cytochrome P450